VWRAKTRFSWGERHRKQCASFFAPGASSGALSIAVFRAIELSDDSHNVAVVGQGAEGGESGRLQVRYVKNSNDQIRVTTLPGDGIGPEVMIAVQQVLDAAGAKLCWEPHLAGGEAFRQGILSGVPESTIQSIRETRLVLKGPLETPVGYGEKSANVTLRKLFETFANVRPVRELPAVKTLFSGRGVDFVVVRENVEDLYAGIEHMQTPDVAQCLKLMSRTGCEKIVRTAFELAVAEGRKSVHCATKANIMKLTEGLLKRTFEDVAKEFPTIEAKHIIIDNCAHELVRRPERFEVMVMSNMNGDIISDLASGLVGGLGWAPSANLGSDVAMFEAVHGSAPDIAGKGLANPSALLLAGVMMLEYLELFDIARKVEHALYMTLEGGAYTADVRSEGALSTSAFANAIVGNLGKTSAFLKTRDRKPLLLPKKVARGTAKERVDVGFDVFIESLGGPNELGQTLETMSEGLPLKLKMISNRGTKVYPAVDSMTDCVDHYRCRFIARDKSYTEKDANAAILELLKRVSERYRYMHLERLQSFDGKMGYTAAQGED
jgi:isocitrate dehydrogenase